MAGWACACACVWLSHVFSSSAPHTLPHPHTPRTCHPLILQMYTGSRPWSGLTHSQIIMMISKGEARLVFPPGTPKTYEALMRACTATKPEERPAFSDVVKQLEEMQEELKTAGFLE